jgi:glucokinase
MKHVLALDIGGTNVRVALFNEKYQKVKDIQAATIIGDLDAFLAHICELIDSFSTYLPLVSAIACGVPGRVDGQGHIEILPNIHIKHVPLQETLASRYKLPVYIKNDAVMAALAEGNLGFGKDFSSSYFMTISTGIGGAFIKNHRLGFASDEIGHTLVPFQDRFVELESIASGTGIVYLASLHQLTIHSAKEFFDRVSKKEKLALVVFEAWLTLIFSIFKHIERYYQPQALILTGGVMKSSSLFLHRFIEAFPSMRISFAQFGQDAGLIGAAYLGFSLSN